MKIDLGSTSDPIVFNDKSQNKTNITEQIIIHSISPDSNTMSMSFGQLTFDGDRNFSAYVIIPQNGCQFFENGTKERGSTNWYQLFAKQNTKYPYFPINPQLSPSIMPTDIYYTDYYIVLEGEPQVNYNPGITLHPVFDQSLAYQNVWNVIESVKLDSADSIPTHCPLYQGKPMTVLHHKIVISQSLMSILKDLFYESAIGIPLFLVGAHYRYVYKNNNITTQATLFLGIIVLFFTTLFGLQQVFQPQVMIPELILVPSMVTYSIMFVKILKRINNQKVAT